VTKGIESKEKRQSPRMILQRIITYELGVSHDWGHLSEGKRLRGYLQNIGTGGICFKTKHQLERKMILKVNLPVTDVAPHAPTLAQVLWVRKEPKYKEYRIGLSFMI
jgi:hypothetical protein